MTTLTLLNNPRRRASRRRRRNPDGTFASSGGTSMAANPGRKRKHRRNPEGGVAANPALNPKRRKRRRNPFGVEKVTQQLYGVGLEEMAGGAAGLVGTAWLGERLNENFNKNQAGTGPLEIIPSGQPRDIMYIARRTVPYALAAAANFFLAKAFGLKREVVAAVGVTGAAATLMKLIAASNVAPDIAMEGSLRLGTRNNQRSLPPPSAPLPGGGTSDTAISSPI